MSHILTSPVKDILRRYFLILLYILVMQFGLTQCSNRHLALHLCLGGWQSRQGTRTENLDRECWWTMSFRQRRCTGLKEVSINETRNSNAERRETLLWCKQTSSVPTHWNTLQLPGTLNWIELRTSYVPIPWKRGLRCARIKGVNSKLPTAFLKKYSCFLHYFFHPILLGILKNVSLLF